MCLSTSLLVSFPIFFYEWMRDETSFEIRDAQSYSFSTLCNTHSGPWYSKTVKCQNKLCIFVQTTHYTSKSTEKNFILMSRENDSLFLDRNRLPYIIPRSLQCDKTKKMLCLQFVLSYLISRTVLCDAPNQHAGTSIETYKIMLRTLLLDKKGPSFCLTQLKWLKVVNACMF